MAAQDFGEMGARWQRRILGKWEGEGKWDGEGDGDGEMGGGGAA